MTNALREQAVGPTEFLDPPATLRQAEFPPRNVGCDPRAPYGRLEQTVERARAKFPEATKIVALWTPNGRVETCAEVWFGHPGTMDARAQVVPEDRL